jgi:hypothetical protein
MEVWQVLMLSLILFLGVINLVVLYLSSSGVAGLIKSQKALTDSMQTLSDQMADLEEKQAEMHADVRKVATQFVNLAKSLRGGGDKPWYQNF